MSSPWLETMFEDNPNIGNGGLNFYEGILKYQKPPLRSAFDKRHGGKEDKEMGSRQADPR